MANETLAELSLLGSQGLHAAHCVEVVKVNLDHQGQDERDSQDAAAANHQMALDVLYRVGCQYGVEDADMRALCDLALINFNELQNYSGVTA